MKCNCAMCLAEAPLVRLCSYCQRALVGGRCSNKACFVWGLRVAQLLLKADTAMTMRQGLFLQRLRRPKGGVAEPGLSPHSLPPPPAPG